MWAVKRPHLDLLLLARNRRQAPGTPVFSLRGGAKPSGSSGRNREGPRAGPSPYRPVSADLVSCSIHLALASGPLALRPTWSSRAASALLLGLARVGVCLPPRHATPVRSYRTFHLAGTSSRDCSRLGVCFCGTFRGFPGSASRPPCPACPDFSRGTVVSPSRTARSPLICMRNSRCGLMMIRFGHPRIRKSI